MLGPRTFQRKKEDFICEQCGVTVSGSGYTNHCPQCLWSKHVDIYPGDRASTCGGLMKPIQVISQDRQYKIIHQCTSCGQIKKNKVVDSDNKEVLIKVMQMDT